MKFTIGKIFSFSYNEPSKFEKYRKEISEIINNGAEIEYVSYELNFRILTSSLKDNGQYFRIIDLSLSEIEPSEIEGKKLFKLYEGDEAKMYIREL